MSQVLLIVLGVYLAGCYGYGLYLVYRLMTTPKMVRPTSRMEPRELAAAARVELELGQEEAETDKRRIAA